MSYGNQRDHDLINRHDVRDWLLTLAASDVEPSSTYAEPSEHFDSLLRVAESDLERAWLQALRTAGLGLPDRGQHYLADANARPDFLYSEDMVAVYVDGPVHGYGDVQQRDDAAQQRLEDLGWYVLRFDADPRTWQTVFAANPNVFGRRG
jgi:very-short-patch-repair endonuclease